MTEHRDKLFAAIKELRTSGAHSDFTFTCGTEVHAVHKAIICARSGNFARTVKFNGVEANASNIVFPPEEDDPKLIKLMVQYIYEAGYDPEPPGSARLAQRPAANAFGRVYSYDFPHTCELENDKVHDEDEGCYCSQPHLCQHHVCGFSCNANCRGFVCQKCPPKLEPYLSLHAGMAMIGDKYDVYGLEDLAKSNFRKVCQVHWNTLEFAEAVKYVCDMPVEALKAVIVDTIVAHKELIKKGDIKEVLKKSDGLALEILGRMVG